MVPDRIVALECAVYSSRSAESHDRFLRIYLRVRVRGPSGQDRGSDLGRDPRRHPGRRHLGPRGLRDAGQNRDGGRRGRDHDVRVGRLRGTRSGYRDDDRLRRFADGFRRPQLRGAERHRQTVAGYRPGRRSGQQKGTGRRRPGTDVRLRDQRDGRSDAGTDHVLAPARKAAGRGPQERRAALATAGCEEPGYVRLRGQ